MPRSLDPPSPTVLCLMPAVRWRMDELEAVLRERGVALTVFACDLEATSARQVMGHMVGSRLVAVLHSDEMVPQEMLGRTDSLPGWLEALASDGVPVIRERFSAGGPFEDEWMPTTSPAELSKQLLPQVTRS